MSGEKKYIAHVSHAGAEQLLVDHLSEVGDLCGQFAEKIGIAEAGQLIGLLHDFGKFSSAFQDYLGSATGTIDPDADEIETLSRNRLLRHSSSRPAGARGLKQIPSKQKNKKNSCHLLFAETLVRGRLRGFLVNEV